MLGEELLEKRIRRLQRRRGWTDLIVRLALTALGMYLLLGVVLGAACVQGDSMFPTLREKDLLVFFRLNVSYKAGDIVLIQSEEGKEYVKRIVGLPGQTMEIDEKSGRLMVDGEALVEPYAYGGTYGKGEVTYPLTLKENEYFVLGDHRENSRDSRNYGPVLREQLDGKVWLLFRWQGS